jgi:hypothetical protein
MASTTPAAPAAPPPSGDPNPGHPGNPESLDEIIVTTKTHSWWALWAIAAAVLAAIIWSFVAQLPQQVSAVGVVSAFDYISDLTAPTSGTVTTAATSVQEGGRVAKGQTLAYITPYNGGAQVPVASPVDGTIHTVLVSDGEGVVAGMLIGQVVTQPVPAEGIHVVTYLPASAALVFDVGQVVDVLYTNIASSESETTTATVTSVADVPTSLEAMTVSAGSEAIASQWLQEAGGTPYRVSLTMTEWPESIPPPAPGAVLTVVNTYADPHPIELLFGGN